MKDRRAGIVVATVMLMGLAVPASATVIFGHDVYVGGHDFSHQRFDRHHRGLVYLYDQTPPNPGCRWHWDGHGGQVKVCHLRRLNRP